MTPNPRELGNRRDHLRTRNGEAGGVSGPDPMLADLRVRNVIEAVRQGGLGARWQLGALIGEIVCERQSELSRQQKG